MSNLLCAAVRPPDWLQLFLPANESMYEMMDELTHDDPTREKQEAAAIGWSADRSAGEQKQGREKRDGGAALPDFCF